MDENRILERIKAGDERAFGQLYDQYYRMIASILRKVARCPSSELDFHLNEVFFRVYKGVFSFKGNSKFSTYVYRIGLNYSFQLTKKLKKERMMSGELDENMPEKKLHFEDKIVTAMYMEKTLDILSDKLRSVTVMFYYDDFSIREIAEIERISENAVKNRLYQAREKIKKFLEEIKSE